MSITSGDRFELAKNWRGQGAAHFTGQMDREVTCQLSRGMVLVATADVDPMATGFHCIVEGMDESAEELLPDDVRSDPAYTGTTFVFFTGDVGALLTGLPRSA